MFTAALFIFPQTRNNPTDANCGVLIPTTDTLNNVDTSQIPYTKLKTPDLKGDILHNSIYITFWKRQHNRDEEQLSGSWIGEAEVKGRRIL